MMNHRRPRRAARAGVLCCILSWTLSSCADDIGALPPSSYGPLAVVAASLDEALDLSKDPSSSLSTLPALVDSLSRDALAEPLAEAMAKALPMDEKVSRLFMTGVVGSDSGSPAPYVSGVGGILLFKYNLGRGPEAAERLIAERRSQARSSALSALVTCVASASSLPVVADALYPFVAVDHEGGSVHRFASDLTKLPPAGVFGSLGLAAEGAVFGSALRSGRELRRVGVDLVLAPVVESPFPGEEAFLSDRAYSTDPKIASSAAGAFVRGMVNAGVASAVKHFPGNAADDPHRALPVLHDDAGQFEARISTFAAVFASSNPAFVMVSHAEVPSIDPGTPSCLSHTMVTDILKGQLAFRGAVVADDLRMGAIGAAGFSLDQAAIAAVDAGVDLLLTWPEDVARLRADLLDAIGAGKLSEERINDAVMRVLREQISLISRAPPSSVPSAGTEGDSLPELKADTESFLASRGLR